MTSTDSRPDAGGGTQPQRPGSAAGEELLNSMYRTWLRFAALRALVDAGCPEQLRYGPLTTVELARRCGVHEPSLARLLRAAAATGLLRAVSQGTYALTEAGQALVSGTEATRIRWSADPEMWASLGELTQTLRTGQPPVVLRHGGTYAYLASRPAASAAFDELMTAMYAGVAARLAQVADIPPDGTVVDVGGGKGTFLAALLRARPGLRGVLLDQERPAAAAREYLAASGAGDRFEVVAGDFFKAVPAGADAYLLAHVIHNWEDGDATAILRTVAAAMPPRARLLLVEQPVSADDSSCFATDLDIRLLAGGLGRERDLAEYSALLARAGLRTQQVTELGQGECLITAELGAAA